MTTPSTLVREEIEWCKIWIPDSVSAKLAIPRVLLVGDSIVDGYGSHVAKLLKGKASVGWLCTSRFPTDPAFQAEVLMVLSHTTFDIVHFNNGLHGFDNSDEDYVESLPKLIKKFRAASAGAVWILATTTLQRTADRLEEIHPRTKRIRVRNEAIHAIALTEKVTVTDLFSLVEEHPEFYCSDGVHFLEAGQLAQASLVAATIEGVLNSAKKLP